MPRMKAERTAVDTEKVRSRIQTDIGRHVGQARNIAYRSFLRVLCEPPLDTIAPRQIALVPLEDVDLGCPPEPRIPTNDAAVLINEPNDLAPMRVASESAATFQACACRGRCAARSCGEDRRAHHGVAVRVRAAARPLNSRD